MPRRASATSQSAGTVTEKPVQAGDPGRSPSSRTPHSTDSATEVTALTGTTVLMAPRLRPRLRKCIAAALPTPDSAPPQQSREVDVTGGHEEGRGDGEGEPAELAEQGDGGEVGTPGQHPAGEIHDAVADGRGQREKGTRRDRSAPGRCPDAW
ncbi:hypothetical protein [Streptomyces sp. NPDC093568]|uniref:hypothetical protein n=1 Tax=Streptomyces sp. NPDC093568 TaxID=3366041 RepID=UPI003807D7DF